jgi:hypothetical protein
MDTSSVISKISSVIKKDTTLSNIVISQKATQFLQGTPYISKESEIKQRLIKKKT